MDALVVTNVKIPPARLRDFCQWNADELVSAGAHLLVVCDATTAAAITDTDLPFPVRPLVFTAPLPVFSITRTANYGIRRAVNEGARVVMKTDIDVAFLGNLRELLAVDNCSAAVPRYADVKSYETRTIYSKTMPDGQGTICLTSYNWQRLQGYDERYYGWGRDDNEMCARIREAGIQLNDSPVVAHVAHPTPGANDWNCDGFNVRRWGQNNAILPRQPGAQPHWGMPTVG